MANMHDLNEQNLFQTGNLSTRYKQFQNPKLFRSSSLYLPATCLSKSLGTHFPSSSFGVVNGFPSLAFFRRVFTPSASFCLALAFSKSAEISFAVTCLALSSFAVSAFAVLAFA